MKSDAANLARKLRRKGFDKSKVVDGSVTIGCSQCQATGINGVACHEHGCPNKETSA